MLLFLFKDNLPNVHNRSKQVTYFNSHHTALATEKTCRYYEDEKSNKNITGQNFTRSNFT